MKVKGTTLHGTGRYRYSAWRRAAVTNCKLAMIMIWVPLRLRAKSCYLSTTIYIYYICGY